MGKNYCSHQGLPGCARGHRWKYLTIRRWQKQNLNLNHKIHCNFAILCLRFFFLEHVILIGILFLLNVYNVDSFTDAAITASKQTNGQTMERPLQVCIMQFNINFFCLTKCMYTSNKNCTGTLIFKFENLLFI